MAENQTTTLLFMYAETALHPGTGASLGVVDLPIQRERTTSYPLIQSSSIKGVLRAMVTPAKNPAPTPADEKQQKLVNMLFGPENQDNGGYAGAISFADAKILLFPVRSLAGVFAWITCPAVLARLKRDLSMGGQTVGWELPMNMDDDLKGAKALVTQTADTIIPNPDRLALEEYLFTPTKDDLATDVAKWLAANALPDSADFEWWRAKLTRSLIILHDDDFRDFVTTATEIVARTKLEAETKKVATGALWYQEFLPAETVFYSLVVAQKSRSGSAQNAELVLQELRDLNIDRIQIGGDETTGKGFCKLRLL